MSYACPVSFERVESNTSRLSSFIVSLFVIYYFFTLNVYVLYFLLVDFSTRLYYKKDFSLIHISSKIIKKLFKLKDKYVDSGAKKLAGIFGLIFILLLIISYYTNQTGFGFIVGVIFVICSLLDALINYCVGCKIYFIIKKIYPNFMNP